MSVATKDLRRLHPVVVDARGRRRPGPVLALKRALSEVPVGGVLELLATDPTTFDEVSSWSAKSGHELVGSYRDGDDLHLVLRRLV